MSARRQELRAAPAHPQQHCVRLRAGAPAGRRRMRAAPQLRASWTTALPMQSPQRSAKLRGRNQCAASVPKRPPTSTKRQRRARSSTSGRIDSPTCMHVCSRVGVTSPRDQGSQWQGVSPFATTSMRRSSGTGTMFMSGRRTLRATRARHTRATARSRGKARDASTPEVAHAALWSPNGSRRPRQAQQATASEAGAAADSCTSVLFMLSCVVSQPTEKKACF